MAAFPGPYYMMVENMAEDKIPQVILSPEAQAAVDADPELAKAMQEFAAMARQAMQAVEDGRHASFEEAMEALGMKPERITDEDEELLLEAGIDPNSQEFQALDLPRPKKKS